MIGHCYVTSHAIRVSTMYGFISHCPQTAIYSSRRWQGPFRLRVVVLLSFRAYAASLCVTARSGQQRDLSCLGFHQSW